MSNVKTSDLARKDQEVSCLRGSSVYEPLDMLGQWMSYEETSSACQERCRRVQDCTGFTFSQLDGGCHIADRHSILRVNRLGFSSAPRACEDPSSLSALGMEASAFYVTGGSSAATPWARGAACTPAGMAAAGTRCCSRAGDSCISLCGSPPPLSQQEAKARYVAQEEAADLCAKHDLRLCTITELDTNICLGTGCWLDMADVWTSNPCTLEVFKATTAPQTTRRSPSPASQRLQAAATDVPTTTHASTSTAASAGTTSVTTTLEATTAAATAAATTAITTLPPEAPVPSAAVTASPATTASTTTTYPQETSAAETTAGAASSASAPAPAERARPKAQRAADNGSAAPEADATGSCRSFGCGEYVLGRDCQCNTFCASYGSCCKDYKETCAAQAETEPFAKPQVTFGRWVVAPPHMMGEDCRSVCGSAVGAPCLESAWPQGRRGFERLRQGLASLHCSEVVEGDGSSYHPSTDGTTCTWKGTPAGVDRCREKAPPEVSRLCPCFGAMDLALDERFDGEELDRSMWQVDVDCWGGGNHEKQCYRDDPENIFVKDGQLVLRAVRGDYHGQEEDCTMDDKERCTRWQPFTSARLRSNGSPRGIWRYGRVEVRAQMPNGKFLWPAIWMLPDEETYGQWAASGEIDIAEYRGDTPHTASGSLHFWGTWPNDRYVTANFTADDVDLSAGFHNYALEWTADLVTQRPLEMRWYVDDHQFSAQDLQGQAFFPSPLDEAYLPGSPWDQHFYLILNLAVGGSYFRNHGLGEMRTTADFDTTAASWAGPALVVEHVRVWTQPSFEEKTVI